MTDKQIIIDGVEINPYDWLEPYKPIPACEIKDCDHLVYAGNDVFGCRIAEDGLVCDDFNNDDECCMYRQLEYYKENLKRKEQECEELKERLKEMNEVIRTETTRCSLVNSLKTELDQYKAENEVLEKVNKSNQEKIKKLNEQLEEEFINHQYGEETVFFEMEDYKQAIEKIKEIVKKGVKIHDDIIVNKQILQICDEVISE